MISTFRSSLSDSENLRLLYIHCVHNLNLPGDYSDLLRMSFIYCLSALDKLIHDIILHEAVEIFVGRRSPTPKYLSETVTLENYLQLSNSDFPPKEIIFENIVRRKLGYLSFMDPAKLADGLSLVWNEPHKWQVIAKEFSVTKTQAKTKLKNLVTRRNAIVHETDRDPGTDQKLPLSPTESEEVQSFISDLGEVIYRLV